MIDELQNSFCPSHLSACQRGYEAQSPIHKRKRNASESISDELLWSSESEQGKWDNWPMDISDTQSSSFPGLGRPEARASGIDLYGFWPKLHMSGSTLSNININSFWNGS